MLIFILKFSACLAIFMAFYKLALERLSIHVFKRFYLLGALAFAILIPNIAFVEYVEPVIKDTSMLLPMADLKITSTNTTETPTNYFPLILWSIYAAGALVFLLKFGWNLKRLISRIRKNPKHKTQNLVNVLIENLSTPYTFFNYLFFNKKKFENREIPEEVLLHERTHAIQKHSIDIIMIECFQIVFWFNPLIPLLKEAIKLNHEFLADRSVLKHGIQPTAYQHTLLAYSSKAAHQSLAHAINYSSIKKRFTVMKTTTSKTSIWLRSLLLLPLLAILLYSFTGRKQVVKPSNDLVQTLKTEGVSEALMTEYRAFIAEFKATNQINGSTYERMVSIYDLMSEEQRVSVAPYPAMPRVDLSKVAALKPNKEQFESWKDSKTYALWLDGKPISNGHLNTMSMDNVVHYSGSFVHTNARSERFPQPYQYSLYTKQGFQAAYQESKVKTYKSLSEKYSKAIKAYLNGTLKKHSELKILKEQMDRTYDTFSASEKEKHQILPPPPLPAKKSDQQGATQKQIATYNTLAKKYNEQPKNQRVVKLQDLKQLEHIYSLMTNGQKANAEAFPECPPPPPPKPNETAHGHGPNAPSNSGNTLKKRIYNAKFQNEPYVIFLNHKGQLLANDEIADLESITEDFKVLAKSKGNKQVLFKYLEGAPKDKIKKIKSLIKQYGLIDVSNNYGEIPPPPPPPPAPQVPEKKNNTSKKSSNTYPEIKEVPLPPPPPPAESPLDHVIRMAKKNAQFIFEGKVISSDKAIALLKSNDHLNISTRESNSEQPKVFISSKPMVVED